MNEPRNRLSGTRFAGLAGAAIAVGLYAIGWQLIDRLPPDLAGRRIASLAFLVFVGSLSSTAFFVTRGAHGWLRICAALIGATAAAACFVRPAESSVGVILGAGLLVGLGSGVAFAGRSPARANRSA